MMETDVRWNTLHPSYFFILWLTLQKKNGCREKMVCLTSSFWHIGFVGLSVYPENISHHLLQTGSQLNSIFNITVDNM